MPIYNFAKISCNIRDNLWYICGLRDLHDVALLSMTVRLWSQFQLDRCIESVVTDCHFDRCVVGDDVLRPKGFDLVADVDVVEGNNVDVGDDDDNTVENILRNADETVIAGDDALLIEFFIDSGKLFDVFHSMLGVSQVKGTI